MAVFRKMTACSKVIVPTSVLVQDLQSLAANALGVALIANTGLAHLVLGVLNSVGVKAEQNLSVAEWVLLLHVGPLGDGIALGLLKHGLHLGTVDEAGDVGVADDVGWEEEVLLDGRGLGGGAVNGVKGGKSG